MFQCGVTSFPDNVQQWLFVHARKITDLVLLEEVGGVVTHDSSVVDDGEVSLGLRERYRYSGIRS